MSDGFPFCRGAMAAIVFLAAAAASAAVSAGDRSGNDAGPISVELGNRLWLAANRYDNKVYENDTGNLGSRLRWSGVDSLSNETTLRITQVGSGAFLKAFAGLGVNRGGSLDDEDYATDFPTLEGPFTGKFLDTYAKGGRDRQLHGAVDIGFALPLPASSPVRISTFVGVFRQQQGLLSKGVRCNADEASNLLCGPPGKVVVPFDQKSIGFETTMQGVRTGIEASLEITKRLSLRTEAVWLRNGRFRLDDSHFLRAQTDSPNPDNNLGPVPNIVSRGKELSGLQLETEFSWAASERLAITAAARYWRFDSGRADTVFGARLPIPVETGETNERSRIAQYGMTIGVRYRF